MPPFLTSSDVSVFTSGNDEYFLYLMQEKLSCDLYIPIIKACGIFNWLEVKESPYLCQCLLDHPGELVVGLRYNEKGLTVTTATRPFNGGTFPREKFR